MRVGDARREAALIVVEAPVAWVLSAGGIVVSGRIGIGARFLVAEGAVDSGLSCTVFNFIESESFRVDGFAEEARFERFGRVGAGAEAMVV